MENLKDQKQKANELRKEGNIEEALLIYRNLWKETSDKFDGAGLLHCLRKLKLFDEAAIFADELIAKYPKFKWCRIEVIWTYISGVLYKLEVNEPLENVIQIAQKILDLNPDSLAKKMVVFKVLKSAKTSNDWKIINEWVVKLDPKSLSTKPMTDSSGREGWNDQALWYNYRLNSFIKEENLNEAVALIDEISDSFPRQTKFFLRLKAKACYQLGNSQEAEKIYENLCSGNRPDWWLLHEYAKVIRDSGRKENALKLMYKAANSNPKLDLMVSLFEEIGTLCMEMEMNEEALAHLILCKNIRYENEWSVPDSVLHGILDLDKIIVDYTELTNPKDVLRICRNYWKNSLGENRTSKKKSHDNRKVRKEIIGEVKLGRNDQSFCFIISDNLESFFCFKSDLPSDIKENDGVTFDAIPSFDKKKNRESWRASNVRRYTSV